MWGFALSTSPQERDAPPRRALKCKNLRCSLVASLHSKPRLLQIQAHRLPSNSGGAGERREKKEYFTSRIGTLTSVETCLSIKM